MVYVICSALLLTKTNKIVFDNWDKAKIKDKYYTKIFIIQMKIGNVVTLYLKPLCIMHYNYS